MSSGRTHTLIALASAPLVSASALYCGFSWQESAVFGALELIAGTALSPDLDIRCMWSKCWLGLFWPYQKALSHRSIWSHGPIVGTLGRLVYLAVLAWLLSTLGCLLSDVIQQQPLDFPLSATWLDSLLGQYCPTFTARQIGGGFVAMEIGSMLHVAADLVSTKLKRAGWFEGAHYR